MRKSRWIVGLCVMALLTVFPGGTALAGKTVIKLATVEAANLAESPALQAATVFKNLVESRVGDRVEIKLFPGRQLGNERELIEGLRMGTVEMAITSDGPVGGFFEPILVLGIPYAFPSAPIAWKVLDGPFGQELMEAMRKQTGIRCLAVTENGFRHFTNSKHAVKTPADMKGLKIRTMENPTHMAIVKALGANPTPISFGELYSSLQQGIVDGQENPVAVLYMMKGYEVQKYLTLDGHVYNPSFLWMNDRVFEKLDAEARNVFLEAGAVAGYVKRAGVALAEATKLEEMVKKGLEVYTPTADQIKAFQTATQGPVLADLEKKIGKEWIEKMMTAIEEAQNAFK